jgi:hypothetical protein
MIGWFSTQGLNMQRSPRRISSPVHRLLPGMCCLLVMLLNLPALAVKTSHWVHTTEADFKKGTFHGVVASNLGDLKLSRDVKSLLGQDPHISIVFALAQMPDGTIYAGTGPEGILLSVKDDKVTKAAEVGEHSNIFSLMVDSKGRLLIGTGGEKGEILRMDRAGEKPKALFSSEDVQYIWSMVETPDGMLYAATGPNGQLFQISPDGTSKVVFDSDENNLLCMLSDGKDELYIGTDPNGLVYRVNRKTGEMFVVYDAPEDEVSALVLDAEGNLYAATAEASEQEAEEAGGAMEQVGRPESERRDTAFPSQLPRAPEPPEVPSPAPGDPLPIPKTVRPMSMLIQIEPGPREPEMPESPTSKEQESQAPTAPPAMETSDEPSAGNAIYKIDPQGFVTEIFRQRVSVFAMVEQAGRLIVATGADGEVYQVDPQAEETLVLAKADSKDVVALLPAKDGRIFMGLANSGDISAMTPGYATEGTFVSPVLDATQISRFGKIELRGTLAEGAMLKIATRSGNVEESTAPGWSKWSDDLPATTFVQVASPSARFFQYRLTFTSAAGKATPVVEEVNVSYQMPNLAPQVRAISQKHDEEEKEPRRGSGKTTLQWHATDANEDPLEFSLYYRRAATADWILLKDKLKDPTYDWDTKGVGDGRYEIKVQASDLAVNEAGAGKTGSRVSDPLLVDNTAPLIGDISSNTAADSANVKLKAVDRASTVASLEYAVDSAENWQLVLPSDKIADSPEEAYEFKVGGLTAGAHQIMFRATDAAGNRAFESIGITVPGK